MRNPASSFLPWGKWEEMDVTAEKIQQKRQKRTTRAKTNRMLYIGQYGSSMSEKYTVRIILHQFFGRWIHRTDRKTSKQARKNNGWMQDGKLRDTRSQLCPVCSRKSNSPFQDGSRFCTWLRQMYHIRIHGDTSWAGNVMSAHLETFFLKWWEVTSCKIISKWHLSLR